MIKEPHNPTDKQRVIEFQTFIIQKKDGTRIGVSMHHTNQPYGTMEIGGFLIPSERGKGYGTEAAQLMVDFLFLHRNIVQLQATTNVRNKALQRILEKAGLRIEGTAKIPVRERSMD